MSVFHCRWCARAFPARKVHTVSSPGGRVFWICNACIKIGRGMVRAAEQNREQNRRERLEGE